MKLRKNQMISPKNFAISSGEKQKYPPRYLKIHRERLRCVLFLKKVHSWEGITETVHGSFLLVLRVYSFVSFAPAGVHDLLSSLSRRYTKIALCLKLSGIRSEF